MTNNEYIDILKRIKILLNRNLWLEAKEYLQIELDNLEKTFKLDIDEISKKQI